MDKHYRTFLIKVFLPIVMVIPGAQTKKVFEAFTPLEIENKNSLDRNIEKNSIAFKKETSLKELLNNNIKRRFKGSISEEVEVLMKQKKGQLDEVPQLRKLRSDTIAELHNHLLSDLLPRAIASKIAKFDPRFPKNTSVTLNRFEHMQYTDGLMVLKALDLRITYLEARPPSEDNPRFPASIDIISLRKSRSASIDKLIFSSSVNGVGSVLNLVSSRDFLKELISPSANLSKLVNKDLGLSRKALITHEGKLIKLIALNQKICILEDLRNM
jgi:hypothetical protein